jgi:DNA invertase Pin-like site-specific DNA recombinase
MEMVGEYVDAGCSGMSSQNHPQLLKLLDDAKSSLFKHLLVYDISRLSRGAELPELITELQGAGVTMHFVDNKMVM